MKRLAALLLALIFLFTSCSADVRAEDVLARFCREYPIDAEIYSSLREENGSGYMDAEMLTALFGIAERPSDDFAIVFFGKVDKVREVGVFVIENGEDVIEISEPRIDSALAEETVKLLTASPLIMMKRTKSGEKEVDITSFIKNVSVSAEKTLKVTVTLTGGEGSLNPEMLVAAMREKLGVLKNYPEVGTYTIMRTNVYFADGREFE